VRPLRVVAPVVEEIARTHADRLRAGKLDIDHAQATRGSTT